MFRAILVALLAVAIWPHLAAAQTVNARVVTTCGTVPAGIYVAGAQGPTTVDVNGNICGNTPGGGSGVVGTSPTSFQVTLTASVAALPSHAYVNGVTCSAGTANTATIFVGGSGVNTTVGTGGTGYPLGPGQSIAYAVNNSNLLYIIDTNTSDTLACTGN